MLVEQIEHDSVTATARARQGGHLEALAVVELKRSHPRWERFGLDDSIDITVHAEASIAMPATSKITAEASVRRSKNPMCCLNRITAKAALSALSSAI